MRNVSSEQELLELLKDDKITEDEYEQLLDVMRKSPPSDSQGPTNALRKRFLWFSLVAIIIIAVVILLPMAISPKANSLPKTKWNCLSLLDFSTQTALGSFEMYYEEKYHKATGYDAASQKQKDAMVEQWIQEIHGLDYEKAVLATAAIGDVKARKAIAVLTEAATAKGGDNRIKWIAVRGLAKIADRETVPVLITLIDHYNKNVRTYAKVALAEITGQFFGDSKEQWQKWWEENKQKDTKPTSN